ncbi:protein MAIN-LIKE 1-like [Arachis ipaensis]|uniref:protein MAIN-LIKE 1-like n=1 Tax=Arachis ipaensis TaxID=130454 RepID=UPI0007AF6F01|nr:protein MAIN-LIKE 1-like [Arachis ipaensis]
MVENCLCSTGFYHVSRIGFIKGFYPLLAALVRWRPETHTFVLPVGEVTVTLEDVAQTFGLLIDGEPVSGWTDSSGDFLQSQSIAIFGREPVVSSSSKSFTKMGWVRGIRDAEPLDTEKSIKRYVICQIFYLLGSTQFTDKSTAYAHAKYLPLLRDFEWIHTYSWGSACLAHLYRALCHASRWSQSYRSSAWLSKTIAIFRQEIDYMDEFVWRPYEGLIIPDELHGHFEVCDIVVLLVSFECVEWHHANQVMRQFGYAQPPPPVARDVPSREYCITLRGIQLYDWTVLHGGWIEEWGNRRNTQLQYLHPLPT